MADAPIPISLSIADPVTAAVIAGFNFGTALLTFLATEKGQILVGKWIEDNAAAEAWIAQQIANIGKQTGGGGFWTNVGNWINGLFK